MRDGRRPALGATLASATLAVLALLATSGCGSSGTAADAAGAIDAGRRDASLAACAEQGIEAERCMRCGLPPEPGPPQSRKLVCVNSASCLSCPTPGECLAQCSDHYCWECYTDRSEWTLEVWDCFCFPDAGVPDGG